MSPIASGISPEKLFARQEERVKPGELAQFFGELSRESVVLQLEGLQGPQSPDSPGNRSA